MSSSSPTTRRSRSRPSACFFLPATGAAALRFTANARGGAGDGGRFAGLTAAALTAFFATLTLRGAALGAAEVALLATRRTIRVLVFAAAFRAVFFAARFAAGRAGLAAFLTALRAVALRAAARRFG